MLRDRVRQWIPPLMLVAILLGLWEGAVSVLGVPPYILPAPSTIAGTFFRQFPLLLRSAAATGLEILMGLALGGLGGLMLAVAIHHSRLVARSVQPFIIASQMIPVFAIAPLLIVWFGYGLWPKVAVAALIGFFPVVVNEVDGLRSASPEAIDLFRTLGASRWQVFTKLLFPASLPSLLSGMKVAATLSVVGATIGEWVGARQGLGYLMLQANAMLRVDLVFAAILMLTLIGLLLFAAFRIIERYVLRWRTTGTDVPR